MLTCLNCRVTFSDNKNQQEHYKSEWHKYNLMRKIASMEPVSHEFFLKVQKNRMAEELQQKEEQMEYICELCKKTFRRETNLRQHLTSRKHLTELHKQDGNPDRNDSITINCLKDKNKPKFESMEEPEGEESWEEVQQKDVELNINECLFCPIITDSLDQNLKHMSVEHSFFVNDIQFCVDVEGLICYLGEKIKHGLRCIFCPDTRRGYHSLEAVQKHMISKGHCRMKSELGEILEWAPFYDYSETYPDNVDEDEKDVEFEVDEAEQKSDWELVLPSGAVIGHRSLQRFYKQKYNPRSFDWQDRAKIDNKRHVCKIMTDYKALGWVDTCTGPLAMKRARDMKYFSKLRQHHDFLRTNKVKNLASQPHFRGQTLK